MVSSLRGRCPRPLDECALEKNCVTLIRVLAAEPGFEPGQKDSKSSVLPLHNSAIYLMNRFYFIMFFCWCRRSGSNRHGGCPPTVFETAASAYSATSAWSGRRDSNSRLPPWQGGILPLNYFRLFSTKRARNNILVVPRRRFELL